MKSVNEILSELGKLLKDARLSYPPANTFSNAPLALIQTGLEARLLTLMWIIEDDEDPQVKQIFKACETLTKMWKIAKDHNAK